jgi:two-component system sensor histidine kinase/response regulator
MSDRPTILVVDDNPQNRKLVQAILDDEEYTVLQAASGEEALALLPTERINCVLLDVRMPGMDGFETCARIRALPGSGDMPIVFLTASRDVDTFDEALRAGGDDFLTKPVSPTELLVRVQTMLKLGKMGAELRESYELVRRQRDDLMRMQLQKERLTGFVVHDLKNPLNSLDLHAQLLLRDKQLSTRSRDSVLHIRDEARSLLRLVLNLLDISKSEEGRLAPKLTTVNMESLSAELIESLQVRAQSTQVTLSQDLQVATLEADIDLLRRVLENLFDNAFRHAPSGSEIRLSSKAVDGAVEIRIADGGRGIADDMRDKIFQRFVQVENTEMPDSRAGRGLGLAFCKIAIEAHGGTIWVEDAKPGAVFCLRLPQRS